ncbi:MAG: phage tail protein [Cyanobacteria bacterium P01_F01_bin.86]
MATPWALLGTIQFQLADAPIRLEATERTRFVRIPRIEQKPSLQWTGDELRTLRMEFQFNAAWCNPDEQLRRLQQARQAHEPMNLILGNGEFRGYYLIEQIQAEVRQTDGSGQLLWLSVPITLTETTDRLEAATPATSPFQRREA